MSGACIAFESVVADTPAHGWGGSWATAIPSAWQTVAAGVGALIGLVRVGRAVLARVLGVGSERGRECSCSARQTGADRVGGCDGGIGASKTLDTGARRWSSRGRGIGSA